MVPKTHDADELTECLVSYFETAERELHGVIRKTLKAPTAVLRDGWRPNDANDPWRVARRQDILQILNRLNRKTKPVWSRWASAAYRKGRDLAGLSKRMEDGLTPTINDTELKAIEVLTRRARGELNQRGFDIGRRTDDLIGAIQAESVAVSRILGEGERGATERLLGRLKQLEDKGLITFAEGKRDVDGLGLLQLQCKDGVTRNYRVGRYVRMAVRTLSRQATVAATEDTLISNGWPTVQISEHQSADRHDECRKWEGNIYALTAGAEKYYPRWQTRYAPLYHPNCLHLLQRGPALPPPRQRPDNRPRR
jgi:hypothetical protein